MKSLRAFWHWVDNEHAVAAEVVYGKLTSRASQMAREAVLTAAEFVHERATGERFCDAHDDFVFAIEHHPAALRELSLGLAPLLEAMHEAVPEPVERGCLDCGADIGHGDDCPNSDAQALREARLDRIASEPSPFMKRLAGDLGDAAAQASPGNAIPTPLFVKAGETVQIVYDPTEHMNCDYARYARENVGIGSDDGLTPKSLASLQDWLPATPRAVDGQLTGLRVSSLAVPRAALSGDITRSMNANVQPDPRPPECPKDQLHITASELRTYAHCDRYRGLQVQRVELHGTLDEFRVGRSGDGLHVLNYLVEWVLAPMVRNGTTGILHHSSLNDLVRRHLS